MTGRRDYKDALRALVSWQEDCLNCGKPEDQKTARTIPDDQRPVRAVQPHRPGAEAAGAGPDAITTRAPRPAGEEMTMRADARRPPQAVHQGFREPRPSPAAA